MRQLKLIAHGEPSEVIELNTVSEPALGPEEVLISMEAAPVNPSDFLFVRGIYGVQQVWGLRKIISGGLRLDFGFGSGSPLRSNDRDGPGPPALVPVEKPGY